MCDWKEKYSSKHDDVCGPEGDQRITTQFLKVEHSPNPSYDDATLETAQTSATSSVTQVYKDLWTHCKF